MAHNPQSPAPASHADTAATVTVAPAPAPWAFETSYAQPLPSLLQFNPHTGFSDMTNWVRNTLPNQYPDSSLRICPVVATYPNSHAKKSWTGQGGLSDAELQDYNAGASLSLARKQWTQAGTVGLVTSSASNASAQSQGFNDWHSVAMARQGNELWVHDPAYDAAAHPKDVKRRVDCVSGANMVLRLAETWPNVEGVYFQGPPITYNPGKLECMGRSAQWVDATVAGTLPWPPNQDSSGGMWTLHYL